MKQLKSVEIFADVICENCTSYNQGRCYQDLPAIPTEPHNKCGKGYWLLNGDIVSYRSVCFELLPFSFVTDVEDLICKNCDYYDLARGECHYYRETIYKSASDDWCNTGEWFFRDDNDEVNLGSLSFSYPRLIKGKDAEKGSSKNRKVKSVETFSDATCTNCVSYNQGRCCQTLPTIPVEQENKCHDGEWLHKKELQNLYGICYCGLPHSFVKDIEDLKCSECIFYDLSKEECHFHRQNVYKSGPNDWCDNGEWLYEDKIIGTSRGSLEFLYPKFMEGKDEKIRSY